jgi:N-acyl-D-aspartate/D-glutamate deacylase
MAAAFDLVIRRGTILDGTGADPVEGDVAVEGGMIRQVGRVAGRGAEEIDAKGCFVSPGFVDIHTHYDGQATWDSHLAPSSWHGATTVVMGNCGVGFAPCRAEDRGTLVRLMEGVEDIPGAALAEGLPWTWRSFPEFLDALDARPHDVDIAAMLPHGALRVFAMGVRGVRREPARFGGGGRGAPGAPPRPPRTSRA